MPCNELYTLFPMTNERNGKPSNQSFDMKYKLYSCVKSVIYENKDAAESQKEFIDKYGCCGVCQKHHSVEEVNGDKSND